jgi:rhamnopyranosyl-N-acetylglucosaminyl-diphospho-decaprenol beta-1,3/1,4-galactofuranosyltransferase
MKILAAIVTHNRCNLLKRCIAHVLKQKRIPDYLLVINNGSTDDTLEMLERDSIHVISQENMGSSGGWHRAIEFALENEFDAIWLMDDDGFPESEALKNLENQVLPGVVCASSVVVIENSSDRFVFPFPKLDKNGKSVMFEFKRRVVKRSELLSIVKDGTYPFVHLFNGALISISAIKKIGNINREYFMYGEEVDYFFRLSRIGRVVSIINAIHFHPDTSIRPYNMTRVYYYIRNSLVLNFLYYKRPRLRSVLILGLIMFRIYRRNGPFFCFSLLLGKHSSVFFSAIFRGLSGKLGKDFNG